MEEEHILTPSELEAKKYIIQMMKDAFSKACDIGDCSSITTTLPQWYNEVKFKRGQKYFADNRFGMLMSNLCGLLTLLADPKGLDILESTGKSSNPEAAKKRYVSTTLHMLSWYEVDLTPDSKSWASLERVRKMHLNASNSASKNKIGVITQAEITFTTFGFMGFALVRPEYLGIRCDNKEDREGFIHFWAVMGHMLGVEDQYNMCLFEIETVEHICMIMIRYIFIPLIQLETPKFKEMTNALLKGLSQFMPHMTYDVQMFAVKRIIGVPGYQFDVDLSKEKICQSMFSTEELCTIKYVLKMAHSGNEVALTHYETLFENGIPLMIPKGTENAGMAAENGTGNIQHGECSEVGEKKCYWIMRSKNSTHWQNYLNDSKYYELSKRDQLIIRWRCFMVKCYGNSVGRYFCEMGLSAVLYIMRQYYDSNIARKKVNLKKYVF